MQAYSRYYYLSVPTCRQRYGYLSYVLEPRSHTYDGLDLHIVPARQVAFAAHATYARRLGRAESAARATTDGRGLDVAERGDHGRD